MNWTHQFGYRYTFTFSLFFSMFLAVWLSYRTLHWLLLDQPLWVWDGVLAAQLLAAALLALPFSWADPAVLAASLGEMIWALGGALLTAALGELGMLGWWTLSGQVPDLAMLGALGGCGLMGGHHLGLLVRRDLLHRAELRHKKAERRRQIAEQRELERAGRGGAGAAEALIALMGSALLISVLVAAAQAGGAL